jgi:hypothetical protein
MEETGGGGVGLDVETIYQTYIKDNVRDMDPSLIKTQKQQMLLNFQFTLKLFQNIMNFVELKKSTYERLELKLEEIRKAVFNFEAELHRGATISYSPDTLSQFPWISVIVAMKSKLQKSFRDLTNGLEGMKRTFKELQQRNFVSDTQNFVDKLANVIERSKLLDIPEIDAFLKWKLTLEELFTNKETGLLVLSKTYPKFANFLAQLIQGAGGEQNSLSLFIRAYNTIAMTFDKDAKSSRSILLSCLTNVFYILKVILKPTIHFPMESRKQTVLKGTSWASSGLLHFSIDSLRFIADAELISHWDSLFVFDLDIFRSTDSSDSSESSISSSSSRRINNKCLPELATFLEEFKGFYAAVVLPTSSCKRESLVDKKSHQLIPFPFHFRPMKFSVSDLERFWYLELTKYDSIPGFSYDSDHQTLEPELHSYFKIILKNHKDPLLVTSEFAGYFSRKAISTFAWNKLSKSEKKQVVKDAAQETSRFVSF